jgi:nitrogen fixation protein FixH
MNLGNLYKTALVPLLLVGCQTSTSPSPENTSLADPAPLGTVAPDMPECALLNNPAVRMQMSAAFELKLMRRCGLDMPRVQPMVSSSTRVPTRHLMSQANQIGGSDILVNNPAADTGGHTTQSETSTIAVGQTVCSAWNDAGEGFGANGFSGFGYSLDGGTTFTDGGAFPNGPSDTNEGDPSLAFSAKDGAIYYAALSTKGLSLWKSTTNCQTFQYVGPIHSGSSDDKELMMVDNTPTSPYYGRIYVGWTNFAASSDYNVVTYSNDGGLTWSAPVTLPGSGSNGQGMWPAVAPNGDVYFALLNRAGSVGGLQSQWIYKSTNGGVAFTKATDIGTNQLRPENPSSTSSCGRQALNGNIRNLPSPQIVIAADASASAGYIIHSIYAYDSDGSGADQSNVFYRRSVDGAATWSAEIKLNDDATTTDQFFPSLGVGETGLLVASWYDRRLDPSNLAFDRYMSFSVDKGLTWSANERVSDVSSGVATTNPNFDGLATCYHGDYDQLAVVGNVAHIVWSDDRRVTSTGPNPDVYYDRILLGASVMVSPSSFEGGAAATGTVMLDSPAPAGGTTVTLVSSVPALVTVPASVVVPAFSQTATFSVSSVSTQTQTPVTITATFPSAKTATASVIVLASPTPTSLVLAPTSVTGGQTSTATLTLSQAAPAGGSVVALSSSATTVATVPATLTIAEGAQTATFTVSTLSQGMDTSATISASLHGITKSATLTVVASAGNATYDATLKVPRCTEASSFCDTGSSLVKGRASLGPEPNMPNTIGSSCADGTSGTFHSDESLDRLRIATVDGSLLAAGKQVNVQATVWVYSAADYLDVFFAPDANNPVWTLQATLPVTGAQVLKTLTTSFTLPAATLPAIRGQWRYNSAADACSSGGYNDRDDLVFLYQSAPDTTPPSVTILSPTNGALVRAVVPVNVDAVDDVGIASLVLSIDGAKVTQTKGTAPYLLPFNSATVADGPHQITVIASDAAGNVGTSSAVSLVVDNTAPTVAITSPASGDTVGGTVLITAAAADASSGVASVDFLVDGVLLSSAATAPYTATWNTATVAAGSHSLTARATDAAGNQTVSAAVVVTVAGNNQAPVVNAGPDLAVTLPAVATLNGSVTDDGLPAPSALTIAWSMTSGPGTATFANPAVAATTVTFSAAGVYVLRLTASDGALSSFDETTVTVAPANQAPVVNAGPDLSVTLPASATLSGTVTDDGLPTPPALTIAWTMTSGPGTVAFANPAAAATTATFSTAGVYILRLTASDGALSAFDEVQVTVAVVNQAPVVNAGSDLAVTLPAAATLSGTVSDDGLPSSSLTIAWTKTSGVGSVTFANPTVAATTATFSAAGVYVLRLTASDGALSAFDEVQVTVSAANQAPVVNAGPDRTVTLPGTVAIAGTATDDGLPTPPTLTIAWTKTSGPGTVTFTPANAAATTAAFSTAGVYVLRLTANDGALSSYDEVQVTVAAANQAPVVNAGPDRTVTLPATLAIAGTVTDDGLPTPPTLTIAWTKTSGPGTVTFTPANAASTTVGFSAAGTYVLRLTASDGALSAYDEVQVVASSNNSTPCTGLCSSPTNFTINGSFQSGNLGTGAVCYQTTSVVHGGNCGNFVSPRKLSVNGVTQTCNGGNWSAIPPTRNGGYCVQTTAGNYSWAYMTLW